MLQIRIRNGIADLMEVSVKTMLLCSKIPELDTQRNNNYSLKKVSDNV